MVLKTWCIRENDQEFDHTVVYAGHPTMFSIELHYGGKFKKFPDITYIDGVVKYVDLVDVDEFSVHEIDSIMAELGYDGKIIMYYHFRLPNEGFHFGLRALGNDDDVLNLSQYVSQNKLIRIYIEHGETNLLTYFMSPKGPRRVIIEEIEEEDCLSPTSPVIDQPGLSLPLVKYGSETPDFSRSKCWKSTKGGSSCSKKLCLEWFEEATMPTGEGMDVEKENTEVDQQIDVEKENTEVDQQMDVEKENTEVDHQMDVEKENTQVDQQMDLNQEFADEMYEVLLPEDQFELEELPFEKDYIEDEQVMKGFDEFNPFEDEDHDNINMDHDNINSNMDHDNINEDEDHDNINEDQDHDNINEDEDHENINEDVDHDNSSEDDDFMVDEENIIPDFEVDMDNFHMSIDTEAEYAGTHNRVSEESTFDDDQEGLEVIDNDEWDSLSDDSGNGNGTKRRAVIKNLGKEKVCTFGEVHKVAFHVGKKYKSKKILKEQIDLQALETRRKISFKKNDSNRLTAVCDGTVVAGGISGTTSLKKVKGKKVNEGEVQCTWRLHASRATVDDYWYIKTYNHKHICLPTRKIKSCTATFISKQIMDQIESNPGVPVPAIQEQLQKKYEVSISYDKAFRAKALATKMVVGDYAKQYMVLRDYVLELQATNPSTSVKITVVPEPNNSSLTRQFKRIYVCLGALKEGFKAGMRDFLGLDGAFMKGPFPGQILTAVGVDPNNGIYPLAYAIVEAENTSSWKWFLECLGEDLDLHSNSNFTFISDRQKGVIPAIAQLFPCAEHRYCLRHIYENMKKKWKSREYKDYLWKCATATTIPEFESIMREFSCYDKQAYEWLLQIPPHHWARSHFSSRAMTDMLLNNLCEVFNSKLVNGRDKPIITSLEFIREYLMKRVCTVMKAIDKWTGPLTPTATRILDANMSTASQYIVRWNGLDLYQVQGPWHDQHVVDMGKMNCSCRKWELTGIPCRHAIAAINEMADNGETVGELYTYVHKVYWVETWKKMYSFKVNPIKGRAMWPKSPCPTTLLPPPHHKLAGRPQKKRKQTEDERSQSQKGKEQTQSHNQSETDTQKLTRRYLTVTCGKCKHKGHNSRTCKGQGGNGV